MLKRDRSFWRSLPEYAIGIGLCVAALLGVFGAQPASSSKPALVSILVQPAIASLVPGQTLTLRAIGTYADGSLADITSKVAFKDDSRASEIRKNLLTARGLGTSEVRAIAKSGMGSDQNLVLTVARISSLAIDPANAGVRLGSKVPWRAFATLEDGTTRLNVTDFVDWSSSDARVLKVGNKSRSKGVSAALRSGSATLSVTDPESDVTATHALTVVSSLARVEATPSARFLQLDDTGRCQALGIFEEEIEADISADVTWTSTDKAIATIDKFGLTEPRRLGAAQLIATDKKTRISSADGDANSQLTVVGELLSLAIDPASREISIGESRRMRALGTFEGSSTAFNLGRRVDWFSSDITIAVLEADGDVHCLAPGTATLSAREMKSGLTSSQTGGDAQVSCR